MTTLLDDLFWWSESAFTAVTIVGPLLVAAVVALVALRRRGGRWRPVLMVGLALAGMLPADDVAGGPEQQLVPGPAGRHAQGCGDPHRVLERAVTVRFLAGVQHHHVL